MKKIIGNRGATLFVSVLLSTFSLSVQASNPLTITVTSPKATGEVTWDIIHEEKDGNTTKTVSVPVKINLVKGESLADKVAKIVTAVNAADTSGTVDPKTGKKKDQIYQAKASILDPGKVIFSESIKAVAHSTDSTYENDRIELSYLPKKATFDFHLFAGGILAGTDNDDVESQFQSSFGFDGIVADASFNYSDLSGNTIDALLTDTYNAFLADLPVAYQPDLSLDLLNDEITFEFLPSMGNVFVQNFTSGSNAYASFGLEKVIPEPSLSSLLAIAAIGLGVTQRRGKRGGV